MLIVLAIVEFIFVLLIVIGLHAHGVSVCFTHLAKIYIRVMLSSIDVLKLIVGHAFPGSLGQIKLLLRVIFHRVLLYAFDV